MKNITHYNEFGCESKKDKVVDEESSTKLDLIKKEPNKQLIRAAIDGSLIDIKSSLKYGADINYNHSEALTAAAEFNNIKIVRYLVENGAIITANDNAALWAACVEGNINIVKYLVENGAKIEDKCLIYAIREENIEVVNYLLENGANVNAKENSPITAAVKKDNIKLVKMLLDNGAKVTDMLLKTADRYSSDNLIDLLADNI